MLKIKVQIKPSHVSGALSVSEGKEPCTVHREQQRLGERSVLLLQQGEEEEVEEGEVVMGVAPGLKKNSN